MAEIAETIFSESEVEDVHIFFVGLPLVSKNEAGFFGDTFEVGNSVLGGKRKRKTMKRTKKKTKKSTNKKQYKRKVKTSQKGNHKNGKYKNEFKKKYKLKKTIKRKRKI